MNKLILFLILPTFLKAQNTIGLPDVINYDKFTYNAGLQNWDIKQDKNGFLYFANNEGLLSFDGSYWNLFPLPNKTIVRSVEIANDKRIYVGGQDEIGYFHPNKDGILQFHSILSLIPEKNRSFGDVWDIVNIQGDLYFRSSSKIFKLHNSTITTFNAPTEWMFLGVSNEKIFAQDLKAGILEFSENDWKKMAIQNIQITNDLITNILPDINGNDIIVTLKNGLFNYNNTSITPFSNASNIIFKNERLYNATLINKTTIGLATSNNGIYIIDLEGNIIQRFSKTEGLQNKNVLSIYADNQHNLWLGLDNGIDFIAYNSAIKQINPLLQDAPGYAALIHQNKLYVGTSNGLSSTTLQNDNDISFSKGDFTLVNNIKGQVWSLAQINEQVILGHHEGAFVVQNNNAYQFSSKTGYWNFLSNNNFSTGTSLIAGNYRGISLFSALNNGFQQTEIINDFSESSRYIAIDNNNAIWVSHPYHGVFQIKKTDNGIYKTFSYTEKNGLPSTLNNHVFKLKNEIVIATIKGIYTYNLEKKIFEPSIYYQKLFGTISLRYVKEDLSGNIWFVSEKTLGVLDLSKTKPNIILFQELTNKVLSGFEFVYPVNNNNIFIGGSKGVFHINYEKYKNTIPDLTIQIRSVTLENKSDSLIFGGYNTDTLKREKSIDNDWKLIRFEFTSPIYGLQNNLEFSYRLKGFDKDWSDWSKKTEKEFTNLPHGSYTFEVKVRNNVGIESPIASYRFTILPPWYKSIAANVCYVLVFGCVIFGIVKWQKKKFKKQQEKYDEEQKKLLYILELERTKKESEIVALQNEKLEADINFQNSELATSAMHLVKKGELLSKIKTELSHVSKGIESPKVVNEIKKITKALNEDDNMDKEWEHFAKHFDKVHSDFLVALKDKHPTITPNELKLSAYLRMNLSTKEIAQLMNISVRGVEIGRYRLRKKLAIPTEVSLFDYLIAL